MNQNLAAVTDEEAPACFSCGKEIASGQWFARIKRGERRLVFCRPHCLEVYLQQGSGTANPGLNPGAGN